VKRRASAESGATSDDVEEDDVPVSNIKGERKGNRKYELVLSQYVL